MTAHIRWSPADQQKLNELIEGRAHSFGRVVGMGQRLIGNDSNQVA